MGSKIIRKKPASPSAPVDRYFARQMRKRAFRDAYEELGPEFDLVSQIIALRARHNLTQRDLAARVGTPQPSIARLETTRRINDLGFVRRIAAALDADVEVRLVPRTNRRRRAHPASAIR